VSESESKLRSIFGRMFRGEEPKPAAKEEEPAAAPSPSPPPPLAEEPVAAEAEPGTAETVPVAPPIVAPPAPPVVVPPPASAVAPPITAPAPPAPEPDLAAAPKKGWFERLRSGLSKTSSKLTDGITSVFTKRKLDAAMLEELEDLLIQADLGIETASRVSDALSVGRFNKDISPEEVKSVLAEEVEKILRPVAKPLDVESSHRPHVILVVGVNGTGKTTTIGKLSRIYAAQGKRVMLAAGDTFRAAAVEQLKIWAERTGSGIVAGEIGADAASLAFDALRKAKEEARDILIIDTAGRLQNKAGLMAELEKIVRVIKKFDPSAPHTVLLTLDATTGQNALNQVEIFRQTAGVTGLIMTKLDGTARGGILVAIAGKYGLPVHAIGVGESAEDLQAFDARDFARAIAGL
jgi:fused signal recognition particle receptor